MSQNDHTILPDGSMITGGRKEYLRVVLAVHPTGTTRLQHRAWQSEYRKIVRHEATSAERERRKRQKAATAVARAATRAQNERLREYDAPCLHCARTNTEKEKGACTTCDNVAWMMWKLRTFGVRMCAPRLERLAADLLDFMGDVRDD